jgi:Flp pilus assembly protein TadG
MWKKGLEKKKSETGQVLVEFAMVVMVFILIIMGTFDIGRVVLRIHQLTQIAREGARAASLSGDIRNNITFQLVMEKMEKVVGAIGLRMNDVNIRFTPVDTSGDGIAEIVEVTVSQPIEDVIGVSIIPGLNNGNSISSTITMPLLFRQGQGG